MRHGIKLLSLGVLCLMGGMAANTGAWAQSQDRIPEPLLELDHQRCMKDCVPGFGEAACKALCDCTMNEFRKRLNYSQYLDMSVQLSRNEIKPETRKMLDSVAHYCTAEIDKAGIAVGADAAKPADKPDAKPETPKSPK